MEYLYARVSTTDQDTGLQERELVAAYPDGKLVAEKVSGVRLVGRKQLESILFHIREGDTLVVWKLDRLARSMSDLCAIVDALEKAGAHLKVLTQPVDTSDAAGKAFLQMLGVFAEFETGIRKERQMVGIAAAKAKGRYKGRQPVNADKLAAALADIDGGMSKQGAADKHGIGVATIYRKLSAKQGTPDPKPAPVEVDNGHEELKGLKF